MTARMSDTPAAQAARDRRDANQGQATGQAAPEPTGTYAAAQEKAKADRQPRVDQSDQVKTMLASLRMQETGSYEGDYTAQGEWIEGQTDKSMGAYGIMSKNWAGYTSAAGIPNANWRDSRSQDRVAGQMVNNLANRFGGNMGLVAAAFFAGAVITERVVEKYGYQATADQISSILGDTVGDYAKQVVGHGAGISTTPYGIEHGLSDFNSDVGFKTGGGGQKGSSSTPQDIVRQRMVALAGMGGTRAMDESWEETSEFTQTNALSGGSKYNFDNMEIAANSGDWDEHARLRAAMTPEEDERYAAERAAESRAHEKNVRESRSYTKQFSAEDAVRNNREQQSLESGEDSGLGQREFQDNTSFFFTRTGGSVFDLFEDRGDPGLGGAIANQSGLDWTVGAGIQQKAQVQGLPDRVTGESDMSYERRVEQLVGDWLWESQQ